MVIGLWHLFQWAILLAYRWRVILTTCKSWDDPPSTSPPGKNKGNIGFKENIYKRFTSRPSLLRGLDYHGYEPLTSPESPSSKYATPPRNKALLYKEVPKGSWWWINLQKRLSTGIFQVSMISYWKRFLGRFEIKKKSWWWQLICFFKFSPRKLGKSFTHFWLLHVFFQRLQLEVFRMGFMDQRWNNMSHEKSPPTFHYTGWLIGILILVYYNPYIPG